MDPAGPYYEYHHPLVRLDPTDATFVDVIHTDSKSILIKGFGSEQAMGHADYYPNGGYHQPGCHLVDKGKGSFTKDVQLKPGFLDPPNPCVLIKQ